MKKSVKMSKQCIAVNSLRNRDCNKGKRESRAALCRRNIYVAVVLMLWPYTRPVTDARLSTERRTPFLTLSIPELTEKGISCRISPEKMPCDTLLPCPQCPVSNYGKVTDTGMLQIPEETVTGKEFLYKLIKHPIWSLNCCDDQLG